MRDPQALPQVPINPEPCPNDHGFFDRAATGLKPLRLAPTSILAAGEEAEQTRESKRCTRRGEGKTASVSMMVRFLSSFSHLTSI
jgi:hypothetical protein